MAQLSGTPEHLALKEQIWENPEATDRLRSFAGLCHAPPEVTSFAAAEGRGGRGPGLN